MATLDTLQAEVNTLTTATTSILSEVQTKKAVLDAAAADAVAASGTAATSAANALASKDSAAISATLAANTATALTGFDLAAIAETKGVTAVDVFVYDTSKDSDGGAWRKRTQGTSWHQETLNTATRGSRKEFPAVAVIVAEADTVTIYDGDDPDLPMWMVFNANAGAMQGSSVLSSLAFHNGELIVGGNGGLPRYNFIADTMRREYIAGTSTNVGLFVGQGINSRNSSMLGLGDSNQLIIVNFTVNDVAMTVLPDAPIDAATGLPVPTIAVATAGGVSVITDGGAVWDLTHTLTNPEAGSVFFPASGGIAWMSRESGGYLYLFREFELPTADKSTAPDKVYGTSGQASQHPPAFMQRRLSSAIDGAVADVEGVTFLAEDTTTPDNSMVAYTTSTFNTGWQNGDIKGAFLSSTDTTSLVGSGELVTNGTFDTDTTGWTAIANTTLTIDTGRLKVTSDANALGGAYQSITTVVGQRYLLTFTGLESTSTSSNGRVWVGTSLGGTQLGVGYASLDSEVTLEFVAETTTTYLQLSQQTAQAGLYLLFDDVSVVAADSDRSVNVTANPLEISGTITRTAVATGADLVAYSGFSAANYLEQPYNSALDFGTGDFCIMGWVQESAASDWIVDRIEGRDGSSNLWGFDIWQTSQSLKFDVYENNANTAVLSTTAMVGGAWYFFTAVRRSGVLEMYMQGNLEATTSGTVRNISYTSTGNPPPLTIGARGGGSASWTNGKASLLRISATAPTAEQIAKIYNDEKFLFQENAQATLYGTSDAVTALAHDDDTNLLHVGTSDGRSVFQGLRRVSNTTNAVGTAISASNGLVVEE